MEATLRAFAIGRGKEWLWRPGDPPRPRVFLRCWTLYRAAADAWRAAGDEGDAYERVGEAFRGLEEDEEIVENVGRPPDFTFVARAAEKDRARYAALRIGIGAVRATRRGRRWVPPKTHALLIFRDVDGRPAIFLAAEVENAKQMAEPFFILK
jgi:hypothetical protein